MNPITRTLPTNVQTIRSPGQLPVELKKVSMRNMYEQAMRDGAIGKASFRAPQGKRTLEVDVPGPTGPDSTGQALVLVGNDVYLHTTGGLAGLDQWQRVGTANF